MILPLILVCLRLSWPALPFQPLTDWSQEDLPRWRTFGEIAVSLIQSQTDSVNYFVRQCYHGKTISAAFGINLLFGFLTEGHLTGLRQLLLIAGVEPNPGPTGDLQCQQCEKSFIRSSDLNQHTKIVHGAKEHVCDACSYTTSKRSNLLRHVRVIHSESSNVKESPMSCSNCDYTSSRPSDLKRHLKIHAKHELPSKHKRVEESQENIESIVGKTLEKIINKVASKEETALKKRYKCVALEASGNDALAYLESISSKIKDYVEYELEIKKGIKLQLELDVQFKNEFDTSDIKEGGFQTYQQAIYRGTEYDVTEGFPKILEGIEKYIKAGSGWVIEEILRLKIKMLMQTPKRWFNFSKKHQIS